MAESNVYSVRAFIKGVDQTPRKVEFGCRLGAWPQCRRCAGDLRSHAKACRTTRQESDCQRCMQTLPITMALTVKHLKLRH